MFELYEQLLPTQSYASQKTHTISEGESWCSFKGTGCCLIWDSSMKFLPGTPRPIWGLYTSRMTYKLFGTCQFLQIMKRWDATELRARIVTDHKTKLLTTRAFEMSCPRVNNRMKKSEQKTSKAPPLPTLVIKTAALPWLRSKKTEHHHWWGGEGVGWLMEMDTLTMYEIVGSKSKEPLKRR